MAKLLQDAASTRKRLRQLSDETDKTFSNKGISKKSKLIIPDTSTSNNPILPNKNSVIVSSTKEDKNNIDNKKVIVDVNIQNIIYLGHIPNAFQEIEMKKFFSQFGKVCRIKLFRSMKTNNPKGYAFIQFEDEEVAKVVSEAMNGYMMDNKQLICNIVPKDKMHPGMFRKINKKNSKKD